MSRHRPGPGAQDHPGIHAIPRCAAKNRSQADSENALASTAISVPFQFVADFQVEVQKAAEFLKEPDLDPQERSLFLAILNTPEALNRICRLAILCDRTEDSGRFVKGSLTETEQEDVFDNILAFLPVELGKYWMEFRREDCSTFDISMNRIFEQFQSSLRKIEIINMNTGESTPLWVNSGIHPAP